MSRFGQTKVQQRRTACGEHYVCRLQVAMQDAGAMCRRQGLGNLHADLQRSTMSTSAPARQLCLRMGWVETVYRGGSKCHIFLGIISWDRCFNQCAACGSAK